MSISANYLKKDIVFFNYIKDNPKKVSSFISDNVKTVKLFTWS